MNAIFESPSPQNHNEVFLYDARIKEMCVAYHKLVGELLFYRAQTNKQEELRIFNDLIDLHDQIADKMIDSKQ